MNPKPHALPTALLKRLRAARSILVFSGAGMSAESGVATFRDAQSGLWSNFDPGEFATPEAWQADPALVWGWYLWRMAQVRQAMPHAGYAALAELARRVPEFGIVTQNVDDLHERAGLTDVVHLHGELFAHRCFDCARPHAGIAIPDAATQAPVLRVEPPRCVSCGGHVRPGVVWFGESLPDAAWTEAVARAGRCELMLVVGTSGVVYPAASLPAIARGAGALIVEINPAQTQLSAAADHCLRTSAAQGLALCLEAHL
ncbi:SIR2 family NAD-dependent protein deacylase [Dokdonella sp.]|uniref:SIR2 family NAD-dependent protein deacylase n=1 Tax=Dokdonella sp. TaxID=2291710 RepID=UPI0031C68123|nr:NAD-dependent deacylase [Dokdonella sp.]